MNFAGFIQHVLYFNDMPFTDPAQLSVINYKVHLWEFYVQRFVKF
jgi:hypothetical protein